MARKTYAVEPGWKQLPGSKRQFQNIKTGQIISRTAYDRDFGRLKQQGIRSPQKQAAMSAPDIRQSRPAPGRASQKSAGAMKLRSIDPLKSHYTRNIPIPFDVFYTGNAGEFTRDAERFRPEYDLAIYNISKNNKIADAGIVYDFFNERNGTTRPNTLVTSRNTKNMSLNPKQRSANCPLRKPRRNDPATKIRLQGDGGLDHQTFFPPLFYRHWKHSAFGLSQRFLVWLRCNNIAQSTIGRTNLDGITSRRISPGLLRSFRPGQAASFRGMGR